MTLGQLAQELGKSANSLANTLRQVGLADRLLYESDIITRDQETRLRNGNSKKIYNRVSSQPSGNTAYPTNSIGAWSKKLNRQLADVINIIKKNHLTEGIDITEFTVLDEEVWKKLEIKLNDPRIRIHKLAASLEVNKKVLAEKLFELGLIDTPNWNQRIDAPLEEWLRSVLSKAADKEKTLTELNAADFKKNNSAGELSSQLWNSEQDEHPEENWLEPEVDINVENTLVDFDNKLEDNDIESEDSDSDDSTGNSNFTLKKLSHKLGISSVRVRHILLSLFPQLSNAFLEDDTYIDDEKSERLIFVYENMADDNVLKVFENEFLGDITQRWQSHTVLLNNVSGTCRPGSIKEGEVVDFDDDNRFVTIKFTDTRTWLFNRPFEGSVPQIGKVPYDEWDWEVFGERPFGVKVGQTFSFLILSNNGGIIASRRQITESPIPEKTDSALIIKRYPEKHFAVIRTSRGAIGYISYASLILSKTGESVLEPNRNSLEVRLKQVHKREYNNKTFRFGEYVPNESDFTSEVIIETRKKSLLGLSSITWSNVSIANVKDRKDFVQAYNDQMYIRAKVTNVNSGGYIMHPLGSKDIELFCFYKNGPTWIDAADADHIIGSEWLVKIEQDPEDTDSSNTKVQAKLPVSEYIKLINNHDCYEVIVVNINDSGANLLINGCIPAFMPNTLVSWDKTVTAKACLNVGNIVIASVRKDQKRLICSQRDANVDPWVQVRELFSKGTVVSGHVVSKKETGLLLSLGIYQAWLPANEISWLEKIDDCQILSLPDDLRLLVKGYDEKRKTIKVSLRDLIPDPWSELDKHLPEDAIVSATITGLTNSGALLKVGNLGFKGYLSFRDVDWTHYTDKDSFRYTPGDKITVKVTHRNKERRQLTCSIKALMPNPWMELDGKTSVNGFVLSVDSEKAIVRLKSGIECTCYETLDPSDEGNVLRFDILHLNVATQQIIISHRKQEIVKLTTLAVGDMFKEYRSLSSSYKDLVMEDSEDEETEVYRDFIVKNISSTGRITAEYAEDDDEFENGILLPSSLTINGYPVNVIFARHIIKEHFAVGETYNFRITHRYQEFNYAVLSIDAADLLDINNIATDDMSMLVSREGVEAMILDNISTDRNLFVQWRGYFGYIPRQEVTLAEGEIPDTLRLRAIVASEHPAQMIRFTIVNEAEDEEDEGPLSTHDATEDLDPDLLDCYRDIQDLPGFNPKLPDYYPFALQVRYEPDKHIELAELLSSDPAYFSTQTFFIDCYRAKDENGYILTIFNNRISISTFCREKEDGDEIRVTSCELDLSLSSKKSSHFGNPIRIAGENIQLVPFNSSALPPNLQDVDVIMALLKYNREVLPELRKLNRGNQEKRGEHYLTLQELLMIDLDREVALCSEDVKIQASEISETAGSLGGYGIEFDAIPEAFNSIISGDDSNDGLQVLVKPNDNERFEDRHPSGVLRYLGSNKWIVELYANRDIDIEGLRKSGIQIKRFPNIRHIKQQIRAIESFVYERNGLDIFSKIARNKLNPINPPKVEEIEANQYFNLEDDSDSQAKALKMALGGSQITLIQGPPGTGKSTVIVDIIRNLVKLHKKVLVCTQSVAPVEELYYKLSGRRGGKVLSSPREVNESPLRCAYLRDDESIEISGSVEEHRQAIKDMMLLVNHLKCVNVSSSENALEELKKVRESFDSRHKVECSEVSRKFAKDILPLYDNVMDILNEYRTALDKEDVENFASEHRTLNLEAVDVVFGTCVGVGVNPILKDLHFDTLIIDEAGKANYAESLVSMMMADEYILVGDDKQLPPYTNSELVKELAEKRRLNLEQADEDENCELPSIEALTEDIMEDVGKSLFGDLKPRLPESHQIMLSKQFRMHPEIGDFVSKLFYEGKVQSVPKAADRTLNIEGLEHPILFIDTSGMGKEARESRQGMSLYNDGEIQVIEEKLLPMLEAALDAGKSVGILSPYGAQVQRMKNRFSKLSHHIFTIDSIQGEEYDIVVFSFVRNTRFGSLNFVDDLRRLNVSFSRAKCNLIMVGHLDTLQNESLHKVDRDAVVAVYEEIMNKKVELVVHRGAMQYLFDDYPPEKSPLIKNLDNPYYVFEDCSRLKNGQFTSLYHGKRLTLFNPVLKDSLYEPSPEQMRAALIGYHDGKPCTMVQPMGLWLSRQKTLNEFEFSAVVYSGGQSPLIMELNDNSLITLDVPPALCYPKGTKVKINVRNNRFFIIKPLQNE
jgi:ribosomal protein S1